MDGRNPAPPKKLWETIVCWYLQGKHHSRASKMVRTDFVHPQYVGRNPEGMCTLALGVQVGFCCFVLDYVDPGSALNELTKLMGGWPYK